MENQAMTTEQKPSLATGAPLNAETWADFVSRLKYHCVGKGVDEHCTADPIFVVQKKRLITGLDMDYIEDWLVAVDDAKWFSPQEYWDDLDSEEREELNHKCLTEYRADFLAIRVDQQWDVLGALPDHTVTGYVWEYVNAHFTREAADAFIQRKKHDYTKLEIFVDSQYWANEFNTIRDAILSGKLVYQEKKDDSN